MPGYYRTFQGNIPDSRSLQTNLADLQQAGFEDIILVTDRGYESLRNLESYIAKGQAMNTKAVLEQWAAAFNNADVDTLVSPLYHDGATNHQVANEPVVGRDAIRAAFEAEFAAAKMVCTPENVLEDGEWAMMEWRDPLGLRGCGFFHIVDGKILFQRGYWDKLSFMKQQEQ